MFLAKTQTWETDIATISTKWKSASRRFLSMVLCQEVFRVTSRMPLLCQPMCRQEGIHNLCLNSNNKRLFLTNLALVANDRSLITKLKLTMRNTKGPNRTTETASPTSSLRSMAPTTASLRRLPTCKIKRNASKRFFKSNYLIPFSLSNSTNLKISWAKLSSKFRRRRFFRSKICSNSTNIRRKRWRTK